MRLHPSNPPIEPITTPLSILDNSVARFAPTGAVFFFSRPQATPCPRPSPDQSSTEATSKPYLTPLSPATPKSASSGSVVRPRSVAEIVAEKKLVSRLRQSLEKTLDGFPHIAGQLSWIPNRGGRVQVYYGSADDPGVGFSIATVEKRLSDFGLDSLKRGDDEGQNRGGKRGVKTMNTDFTELIPKDKLALWNLQQIEEGEIGLPGMQIQLTLLTDGYVLAIKMAHVLADAQTLVIFMKSWSSNAKALTHSADSSSPSLPNENLEPVFNPGLLDEKATLPTLCKSDGVGEREGYGEVLERTMELPCHRYDWWATEVEGYPEFLKPSTENSRNLLKEFSRGADGEKSTQDRRADLIVPPWHTWDLVKPCGEIQISFSSAQLKRLKDEATKDNNGEGVSRLDALLAYIWTLINRARYLASKEAGKGEDDDEVYLNLTLGARSRVSPPLSGSFVGSPIFLAHVKQTVSAFSDPREPSISSSPNSTNRAPTPSVAAEIRRTLTLFTPQTIANILYDSAHEPVPNRIWQAFLGRRHTLVTSWLRLGVWDIDFGMEEKGGNSEGLGRSKESKRGLVGVRSIMPKMDGCVQIMESGSQHGEWVVSVFLEKEASGRMIEELILERGG